MTTSSPHPSTSTSRLAMVANQRRRQRKQQANNNLDKTRSHDTSATTISSESSVVSSASATTAEDKENGHSHGRDIPRVRSKTRHLKRLKHLPRSQLQPQSQGDATANDNATTLSASFDDQSTICSDGIWSTSLQSGMSSKSTATTEDSYRFAPPKTIHSPSPNRSNAVGVGGAMRRVTNRRNYQQHFLRDGNSSSRNVEKSNHSIRCRSQSPLRREFREAVTPIMGNRNSNHNDSSDKNDVAASGSGCGSRSQCRSYSVGRQRQQPQQQQQQKHAPLVLPKSSSKLSLAKRTDTSSHDAMKTSVNKYDSQDSHSSEQQEQQAQSTIRQLTLERDTLRNDSQLLQQKLQSALERQRNISKEKEDIISGLEDDLDALTLALEEARKSGGGDKSSTSYDDDEEKIFNEQKISYLEMELNRTTIALETLEDTHEQWKKRYEEEKKRVEETKSDVNAKMERELKKLKDELTAEREERLEMERRWRECVNTLESKQVEDEKQYSQLAAREEELEEKITTLRKEKFASQLEAESLISEKERELADARSEHSTKEENLREQISRLQKEVNTYSSGYEEAKRNHDKILEGLKGELATARKIRDENHSSLKKEIEEMKRDHEENILLYKEEVESLRSQLRAAKQKIESDRKEHGQKSAEYERRLEESDFKNEELIASLMQCKKELEAIKSEHGKDMSILESELQSTYASKAGVEKDLEETRKQLKNVLRAMDEMALDGGKMRMDLEAIMNEFLDEKQQYHEEIVMQKNRINEQRGVIEAINREKELHEKMCEELQSNVRELEDQLKEKNELEREIHYLKSKLETSSVGGKSNESVESGSSTEPQNGHHIAALDQLRAEKRELQMELESNRKLIEELRINDRGKSTELSKAHQTIQILRSKERYLESRVDSLSHQIARTVQDYEMRLSEARESSCSYDRR
ncbi:hypothetical protein ACHAXS_007635 [Conticribra weissflogii]